METKNIFKVSRLSEAAYLEGIHKVRCLDVEPDPLDQRRVIFVFQIHPDEGRRLVLQFGSSESASFDTSVKAFKGRIHSRLREAQTHGN